MNNLTLNPLNWGFWVETTNRANNMTCHIANQIATHCNQDETILCPKCESFMQEKFLVGTDHWLECVNPQCRETIDLNEGDEY